MHPGNRPGRSVTIISNMEGRTDGWMSLMLLSRILSLIWKDGWMRGVLHIQLGSRVRELSDAETSTVNLLPQTPLEQEIKTKQ